MIDLCRRSYFMLFYVILAFAGEASVGVICVAAVVLAFAERLSV